MATDQYEIFLAEGASIFVGWYAGDFNSALTATFAAYPRGRTGTNSGLPTQPDITAGALVQSGPLDVWIDQINNQWFDGVTEDLTAVTYILRWLVTNVSGGDQRIRTLYQITSQDTLDAIN